MRRQKRGDPEPDHELRKALEASKNENMELLLDQELLDQAKYNKFPKETYHIPDVPSDGNCFPESLSMFSAPSMMMTAEDLRASIIPILREDPEGRYSNKFGAKRMVNFRGRTHYEDYHDHMVVWRFLLKFCCYVYVLCSQSVSQPATHSLTQ